jgi:hypothetical protein
MESTTNPYELPFALAAPSGSLAFPKFAPELSEFDDRLNAIASTLHKQLLKA